MPSMPTSSVLREPTLAFKPIKGDLIEGRATVTLLKKDAEKSTFTVKIRIGHSAGFHRVSLRNVIASSQGCYRADMAASGGMMINDHKFEISHNSLEFDALLSGHALEDVQVVVYDFRFHLVREAEVIVGKLYKEEKCVICADRPATMVTKPCRHVCLCQSCLKNYHTRSASESARMNCPICRAVVDEFLTFDCDDRVMY